MQLPLQISFKNLDPSEAIETSIRKHAERLDRFSERITGCRVAVAAPQRRRRKGRLYSVSIDLTVPQHEIVVNRAPQLDHAYEDIQVAIREAFNAAARQLEDYARRMRGDVKVHPAPPHGRVKALFASEGYGFIESSEGLEIYFHKNSVADGAFRQLNVGDEVRYVVQEGESTKGPQASTVIRIGKHHIREPQTRPS